MSWDNTVSTPANMRLNISHTATEEAREGAGGRTVWRPRVLQLKKKLFYLITLCVLCLHSNNGAMYLLSCASAGEPVAEELLEVCSCST